MKAIENEPSADDKDDLWDIDYRRSVFDWAVGEIRSAFQESTWNAFWQTNVENRPIKEVASSLGLTVEAVYLARSRVLARLRKKVREVGE